MKKLTAIILGSLVLAGSIFATEMTDDEKEAMFIENALDASRILMEAENE